MWSNSVSIEIHAPPETIYAYLADFTRHAEWSSNVKKIELVRGITGSVGAEYKATEDTPRPMTTYARLTGLHAPQWIAWQATDHKVFRTEWRFEIEPQSDAARLTQRVTFFPLTLFANLILYAFRVPRVEKENRASLERIRQRVET